jgi:hypothetical protein
MAKKVAKVAPVKKIAPVKTASKKVAKTKEEGFLLLIVFKITHGSFFSKHSHYTTNLLKVKDDADARLHAKAARSAAKTMSESVGMRTEVIISKRVAAVDKD